MYYVYVLYNRDEASKRKFYIGLTNDLDKRIFEHNSGRSEYTSKFGPWQLVYYEAYQSVKDAAVREKR
ncbi:MAG TPA: GIY-YIG nuclease family protein, partial [Methylomirabilota bacterium]|nr:GIY-YIG nuclease family protein [Methylomirabilota bacterium]